MLGCAFRRIDAHNIHAKKCSDKTQGQKQNRDKRKDKNRTTIVISKCFNKAHVLILKNFSSFAKFFAVSALVFDMRKDTLDPNFLELKSHFACCGRSFEFCRIQTGAKLNQDLLLLKHDAVYNVDFFLEGIDSFQ